MTSTSQFEISTPLSLMLTPTKSLLPAFSSGDGVAAAIGVGAAAGAGGVSRGWSRLVSRSVDEPSVCGWRVVGVGVVLGVGMALLAVGLASGFVESLTSTHRSFRPRLSILIIPLIRRLMPMSSCAGQSALASEIFRPFGGHEMGRIDAGVNQT